MSGITRQLLIFLSGCLYLSPAFSQHSRLKIPALPGTIQLNDSFSIKASEILVFDYTSFIVANDYDKSLFPDSTILASMPYQSLFTDLRNHQHERFLKPVGKPPYFYFKIKRNGIAADNKELKTWLSLPMAGLSQQQAERYSQWVEDFYHNFLLFHKQAYYYKLRLATEEELKTGLLKKGVHQRADSDKYKVWRFVAILQH